MSHEFSKTIVHLTEKRIREVLAALPTIQKQAKKLKQNQKNSFLDVPRLPNIGNGETIVDVVHSQLDEAYAPVLPGAGDLIRDYYRIMEIFGYVLSGGVAVVIQRLRARGSEGYWEAITDRVKMPGPGQPVASAAMLSAARENLQVFLARLESVTPEEEAAVVRCYDEIQTATGIKAALEKTKSRRQRK